MRPALRDPGGGAPAWRLRSGVQPGRVIASADLPMTGRRCHDAVARAGAGGAARALRVALLAVALPAAVLAATQATARPTIEELKARVVLDDYESNIVYGHDIVMDTQRHAPRYVGNRLNCTSCHLQGGTRPDGFPLNVAGVYPKWRSKNGVRNGLGLRIRDCFLYSLNGIMPPEESPEVQAVSAYIHYLSEGETIGRPPNRWGVPTLPDTGSDPNPPRGAVVYQRACAGCHGRDGSGTAMAPAVWGSGSYNAGAGMNNVPRLAGFIWANMPRGNERSLTHQEALDVAAFLRIQLRPFDPRGGNLWKFGERLLQGLGSLFSGGKP